MNKDQREKRSWLCRMMVLFALTVLFMGTTADAAEMDKAESNTEQTAQEQVTEESTETPSEYAAPEFSRIDQFGEEHTLSDYRGKVIFLNFWATWCPPCRAEMPDIQALYEKYQDSEDVVILGVAFPTQSGEGTAGEVAAFLEENGYTYPVLMDEEGTLLWTYGISAFPTTFMIDRAGDIYGYVPGALSYDQMEQIIAQTLEDGDGEPETETEIVD